MITADVQISSFDFGKEKILPYNYVLSQPSALSATARSVLEKYRQSTPKQDDTRAEIVALQLLDYLSSKKNYIRRKSKTFRTEEVYERMLPLFTRAIGKGQPIKLNTICLCTNLCNPALVGESPYPQMASYLAFENMHTILQGAKEIYPPGITVTLGYEGNMFKTLFFHSDKVIETTHQIFKELNETALSVVAPGESNNPIVILDAVQMIEQTFGSWEAFLELVEAKQQETYDSEDQWRIWYKKATSPHYFASEAQMEKLINKLIKWRYAVHALKFAGGKFDGGFMQFEPDTIPFNISGRRSDRIALQLVPENTYVPHQRAIAYHPKSNQWRMKAYSEIQQDVRIYAPRLVEGYSYPFYYEEVDGQN